MSGLLIHGKRLITLESDEKNKRVNQAMLVLDYMKRHGSITTFDAINDLGVLSCPKRICELRNMGYKIKKDFKTVLTRSGVKTHVCVYSLEEEGEN